MSPRTGTTLDPEPTQAPPDGCVTVDARALADALTPYAKVVSTHPTLPILGAVRLIGLPEAELLTIQGTDLEQTLETHLPAAQVGPLEVAVPLAELLAVVKAAVPKRKAGQATVTLTHQPAPPEPADTNPPPRPARPGTLVVAFGFWRHELELADVADYPTHRSGDWDQAPRRQVDGAAFAALVTQVLPAVGTDQTRPVLTAANLELGDRRLTVAATDSYRLAVRHLPYLRGGRDVDDRPEILVQRDTFALAGKLFAASPKLTVAWQRATPRPVSHPKAQPGPAAVAAVAFSDDTRMLIVRPVEGEFPRWRSLLPDVYPTGADDPYQRLDVKREHLLEVLAGFPHRKQAAQDPVTLRLDGNGELTVSGSSNYGAKKSSATLPATWSGPDLAVGVNPGFLADGLTHLPDPVIWLRGGMKPAIVTGPDSPPSLADGDSYLLMPVRLPD